MKLPGETEEEYILMIPFTPRGKDNLAAWMVARNDGDFYGQLVVYRFPKQKLVYGPMQITNRINQDADISRQISLWDQRGSEVIRGNLLVIPIEEALIYIQPIYLRAEGGKIPELKRVIVAYENRIAMEET
ncbi:MAG TPA: membrane protein, partial [Planctomycetia bacterium]|nr:membrane protein [Planctomycetia bacterium]